MTITFHGGPWNRRQIDDAGKVVIRMGIAKKWNRGFPAIGSECGLALYEPSPDRKTAHWLCNEWDGITAKIIKQ